MDKLKEWGRWLWSKPAILFSILGTIAGFFIYKKWKAGEVDTLKDALAVEKGLKSVAVLEAELVGVMNEEERLGDKDAKLEARAADIKVDVAKARREVVEVRDKVEGMTDDEVLARFGELYRK